MAHERMSQYASQGRFDEATGRMREAYGRAHEVIEEHPGYSALACFGVGVAVGAAITLLLASARAEKSWYEDYLPDEGSAKELAQQVRKSVSRMLPDAIARYFQHR
jgi:alpha/beta superfamily hydrolase